MQGDLAQEPPVVRDYRDHNKRGDQPQPTHEGHAEDIPHRLVAETSTGGTGACDPNGSGSSKAVGNQEGER